jgi:hypothetical protein
MADPAQTHGKFVAGARAAALAVPVDPRASGYEAPPTDKGDGGNLEIEVDGNPIAIRPTLASVRKVVGHAYLLGGFELVVAIERAVQRRIDIESLTLRQLNTAVREIPEQARARQRDRDVYVRALNEQLALIPPTERRLKTAKEVLRMLHDEWARIAAAEEQVLREYEGRLVGQFARLAIEAGDLALREWARYEPYDNTAADAIPLTTLETKERSSGDLRLRKEAGDLVTKVWELYESWMVYLEQLHSLQSLVGMGARRIRIATPGADPQAMVENSRKNLAIKFEAFQERRAQVGSKFPAALQVYGELATLSGSRKTAALQVYGELETLSSSRKTTGNPEVERMVIKALIEAVASAQKIGYDAAMNPLFEAGKRLRVEAGTAGGAASNLPGYQQELLERGLTIPASRIIANALIDDDNAAKSPWLQLPARLALVKRAEEGEERLKPYFTPARLHHAALGEVNNALQEVRRKQTEKRDQALLIMDALAMPAGFFTGGATMAAAGAIHAIVRGREMYINFREYQARDALATIALLPMQQAIWEHPSAVKLTGRLIEGGFEIATDLVSEGFAGAILDTVQVALTIGYGAQAVSKWLDSEDPLGEE